MIDLHGRSRRNEWDRSDVGVTTQRRFFGIKDEKEGKPWQCTVFLSVGVAVPTVTRPTKGAQGRLTARRGAAKTTLATVRAAVTQRRQASASQLRGTASFVIAASVAADQNTNTTSQRRWNCCLRISYYSSLITESSPVIDFFPERAHSVCTATKTAQPRPADPSPVRFVSVSEAHPKRPSPACVFVCVDPCNQPTPAAAAGFGENGSEGWPGANWPGLEECRDLGTGSALETKSLASI